MKSPLRFSIFLLAILTLTAKTAWAQVTYANMNLNSGSKFEWKIEHKFMTKEEFNLIKAETDPNKKVINLLVYIKLPAELRNKGVGFNGTSSMNFAIWKMNDDGTFTRSIETARHIPASGSMVSGLSFAGASPISVPGRTAGFGVGNTSDRPGLEYSSCSGGTWTWTYTPLGSTADGWDVMFSYPFYIGDATEPKSFYVTMDECYPVDASGCSNYGETTNSGICAGVNFHQIYLQNLEGRIMVNERVGTNQNSTNILNTNPLSQNWTFPTPTSSTMGPMEWPNIANPNTTNYDPEAPFLTYKENGFNSFLMGGITFLGPPSSEIVMKDTVCPGEDLKITVSTSAGDPLDVWSLEYSTDNGQTWNENQYLLRFNTNGTEDKYTNVTHTGSCNPLASASTCSEEFVDTITIPYAVAKALDGAKLRIRAGNSQGEGIDSLNLGSPFGVKGSGSKAARIGAPSFPEFKLFLTQQASPFSEFNTPTKDANDRNRIYSVDAGAQVRLAFFVGTDASLTGMPGSATANPTGGFAGMIFSDSIYTNTNAWTVPSGITNSNASKMFINFPAREGKFTAQAKYFESRYNCRVNSDTIAIQGQMTLDAKVNLKDDSDIACVNQDYEKLTVQFQTNCDAGVDFSEPTTTWQIIQKIGSVETNLTEETDALEYEDFSGTPADQHFHGKKTGLLRITVKAAYMTENSQLIIRLKDGCGGEAVDTVNLEIETLPTDWAKSAVGDSFAIFAYNSAMGTGNNTMINSPQYVRPTGTYNAAGTSVLFLTDFFSEYTVFHNFGASREQTLMDPSYSFLLAGPTTPAPGIRDSIWVVGTSFNGCAYQSTKLIKGGMGNVNPAEENMYGDVIACGDTIFLKASMPLNTDPSMLKYWRWVIRLKQSSPDYYTIGCSPESLKDNGALDYQIFENVVTTTTSPGGYITMMGPILGRLDGNSSFGYDQIIAEIDPISIYTSTLKIYPANDGTGRDQMKNLLAEINTWGTWAVNSGRIFALCGNMPITEDHGTVSATNAGSPNRAANNAYTGATSKLLSGAADANLALFDDIMTSAPLAVLTSRNLSGEFGDEAMLNPGQDTVIKTNPQLRTYNFVTYNSAYTSRGESFLPYWEYLLDGETVWRTIKSGVATTNPYSMDSVIALPPSSSPITQYRVNYHFRLAPTCMPKVGEPVTIKLNTNRIGTIAFDDGEGGSIAPRWGECSNVASVVNILKNPDDIQMDQYKYQYRIWTKAAANWSGTYTLFDACGSGGLKNGELCVGAPGGTAFEPATLSMQPGDSIEWRIIGYNVLNSVYDTSASIYYGYMESPDITAATGSVASGCQGVAVTLTMTETAATAGATYSWHTAFPGTDGSANFITTGTPADGKAKEVTGVVLAPGDYTLYAYAANTNGCWDTASKPFTVNEKPGYTVDNTDSCWMEDHTLTVNGLTGNPADYTYTWVLTEEAGASKNETITTGGAYMVNSNYLMRTAQASDDPTLGVLTYPLNRKFEVTVTNTATGCDSTMEVVMVFDETSCPEGPYIVFPPIDGDPTPETGEFCEADTVFVNVTDYMLVGNVMTLKVCSGDACTDLWKNGTPYSSITFSEGLNPDGSGNTMGTFAIPDNVIKTLYDGDNDPDTLKFTFEDIRHDPTDLITWIYQKKPNADLIAFSKNPDTISLGDALTFPAYLTAGNLPKGTTVTTPYPLLQKPNTGNPTSTTDGTDLTVGADTALVIVTRGSFTPVCADTAKVGIVVLDVFSLNKPADRCEGFDTVMVSVNNAEVAGLTWKIVAGGTETAVTPTVHPTDNSKVIFNKTDFPANKDGRDTTVTILATNGAGTIKSTNLTIWHKPVLGVELLGVKGDTICNYDDTVTLHASGPANTNKFDFIGSYFLTSSALANVASGNDVSVKAPIDLTKLNSPAQGNYTFSVVVTTANGCKDTVKDSIFVIREPLTAPEITVDKDEVCNGDSVKLTLTTAVQSGNVLTWVVNGSEVFTGFKDNGDGTYSHEIKASDQTGAFTRSINAKVSQYGCWDTSAPVDVSVKGQLGQVTITNPNMAFCAGDTLKQSLTVNGVNNAESYQWFVKEKGQEWVAFGTEITGFGVDQPSNYKGNVSANTEFANNKGSLIITDTTWFKIVVGNGSCADSVDSTMIVLSPQPANPNTLTTDTVCAGESVELSAISTMSDGSNLTLYFTDSIAGTQLASVTSGTKTAIATTALSAIERDTTITFGVYARGDGGGCFSDTVYGKYIVRALPDAGTIEVDELCRFLPFKAYLTGQSNDYSAIKWYAADELLVNGTMPSAAGVGTFTKSVTMTGAKFDTVSTVANWTTAAKSFALKAEVYGAALNGATCISTATITITEGGCPVSDLEFEVDDSCANATAVRIFNIPTPDKYTAPLKWEVSNNGGTSYQDITNFLEYTAPDTTFPVSKLVDLFTIINDVTFTLRLTDGAEGEATKTFVINAIPSKPVIVGDSICTYDNQVKLTATTATTGTVYFYNKVDLFTGADTLSASISGTTATITAPLTPPLTAGNYDFYAWVERNGCKSEEEDSIFVVKPRPDKPVISDVDTVCAGSMVELSFNPALPAGAKAQWFAEGTAITTTLNGSNYEYTTPTTVGTPYTRYAITAIDTVDGCVSELSESAILQVNKKLTKPILTDPLPVCVGSAMPNLMIANGQHADYFFWHVSFDKGTTWEILTNGAGDSLSKIAHTNTEANAMFTANKPATLNDTTWFRLTMAYGTVCDPVSDTAYAYTKAKVDAPTVTATDTVCATENGNYSITLSAKSENPAGNVVRFHTWNASGTLFHSDATSGAPTSMSLNGFIPGNHIFKVVAYALPLGTGCISDTTVDSFWIEPIPAKPTLEPIDSICVDGTATFELTSITGIDSLTWKVDNVVTANVDDDAAPEYTLDMTGKTAGNHNIAVSAWVNGCQSPDSVQVLKIQSAGILPTIGNITQLCVDGEMDDITVTAPAASATAALAETYQWLKWNKTSEAWETVGSEIDPANATNAATEFNELNKNYNTADTTIYALAMDFGVCASDTTNAIQMIVRAQPSITATLVTDPDPLVDGCLNLVETYKAVLTMANVDTVMWYRCFDANTAITTCDVPAFKLPHNGLLGKTTDTLKFTDGLGASASSGYYGFKAVAGVQLNNPATTHGCEAKVSDLITIQITGVTKLESGVNVERSEVCQGDSIVAWITKGASDEFDYVRWQDSTTGRGWQTIGTDVDFTDPAKDSDTIRIELADAQKTDHWIRVIVGKPGDCGGEDTTAAVQVAVDSLSEAGTLSKDTAVCYGIRLQDLPEMTLTGMTAATGNRTIAWYDSVATVASVNKVKEASPGEVTFKYASSGNTFREPRYIYAVVTNGVCPPDTSNRVKYDTLARAQAGQLTADPAALCYTGTETIKLDSAQYYAPDSLIIRWQYWTYGQPYNDGVDGWNTNLIEPSYNDVVSAPFKDAWDGATLKDGDTMYYRAIVYNGRMTCLSDTSEVAKMIISLPVEGEVTFMPTGPICPGDVQLHYDTVNPISDRFTFITWGYYSKAADDTTSYTYDPSTEFDTTVAVSIPNLPDVKSDSIRFYAVVSNGACGNDTIWSAAWLEVISGYQSAEIDTVMSDTICPTGTVSTMVKLEPGKEGQVTWQRNNDPATPDGWVDIAISNLDSIIFTTTELPPPTAHLDTTYWVRAKFGVDGGGACSASYNDSVKITVMAKPFAPSMYPIALDGLDECITSDSIIVFAYANSNPETGVNSGGVYVTGQWEWMLSSPNADGSAGTFMPTGIKGTSTDSVRPVSTSRIVGLGTPPLLWGDYVFRLKVSNSSYCTDIANAGQARVHVWDTMQAGVIAPTDQVVCADPTTPLGSYAVFEITGNKYGRDSARVIWNWIYRDVDVANWSLMDGANGQNMGLHRPLPVEAAYEANYVLSNPGCPSDTAMAVNFRVTEKPETPRLSVDTNTICKLDSIELRIANLIGADSLQITYINSVGIATNSYMAITSDSMVVRVEMPQSGTFSYRVRSFVETKLGESCGYAETDQVSVTVNDSSHVGRLIHVADYINELEKIIIKGTNSGEMHLTGGVFDALLQQTLTGQCSDGHDSMVVADFNTGWATTLPGNYGNTLPMAGYTKDTIGFRAILQNAGCPADTSNWVWYYLETPMSDVKVTTSNTVICVEGDTAMISLQTEPTVITAIEDFYWEKLLDTGNGLEVISVDYLDVPLEPRSSWQSFKEDYTKAGMYYYVFHYTIGGEQRISVDTARVIVHDTSVAGYIEPMTDSLCENSMDAPLLVLNDYRASTDTIWQYAASLDGPYAPRGTGASYQVGNQMTDSGYYRVVVRNGVCPADTTDPTLIEVFRKSDAGTLTANPDVACFGGPVDITANGTVGEVTEWLYTFPDGTGELSDKSNKDNPLLNFMIPSTPGANPMGFRIIVQNGVCAPDTSDVLLVSMRDTLVSDAVVGCVKVNLQASEVKLEPKVHGFDFGDGDNEYDSIPENEIGYRWEWRNYFGQTEWSIITPGSLGMKISATNGDLTVPKSIYENILFKDAEYRVIAYQKSRCADTLEVGAFTICPFDGIGLDPIDPRCIFIDSLTAITPDAVYGIPVDRTWDWRETNGQPWDTLTCEPLEYSWLMGGCNTDTLWVLANDDLLEGSELRFTVHDESENMATQTYTVCKSETPVFIKVPDDTVCVNSDAEFEVDYTFSEDDKALTMDWFRISGMDTLDISTSRYSGAAGFPKAVRPDGITPVALLSGEVLTNYEIINGSLRYKGTPMSMDTVKFAVRISSPRNENAPKGVRLEPPVWLNAKLTVVDSIRLNPAYPKNDTICYLTSATFADSILTDTRYYDVQWQQANKQGGWDSISGATGDTYTTPPLTFDSVLQYRYVASNICGPRYSREAEVVINPRPTAELTITDPLITLCENLNLGLKAQFINPTGQDSLMWFVNGAQVVSPITVFNDKTGAPRYAPLVVLNQDSLYLADAPYPSTGWNTYGRVPLYMDSVVFTIKAANKACTDSNGWQTATRSLVLRVAQNPIFASPADQNIVASASSQALFEIDSSQGARYRWFWTRPEKPTDPSYDQGARDLHLHQPNAVTAMNTDLNGTGFVGIINGTTSNKLTIKVTTTEFDSIMFACEVSSDYCGTDTTLFARLRVIPSPPACEPVDIETLFMCTDNLMVRDSGLVIRDIFKQADATYQWYYDDRNEADTNWQKLDPRKYEGSRTDSAVFSPVESWYNNFYYRCKINDWCWSDTIQAVVNIMPTFQMGTKPFSSGVPYEIWPELNPIPAVNTVDPAYNLSNISGTPLGYPATIEQVKTYYDTITTDTNQLKGNLVTYSWFRAEKNSSVFNPYDSPLDGTNNGTWSLYDQQTNPKDDSIRVVVQLSNTFENCPGATDTVMILVPNCHIDSIPIEYTSLCVGGEVTLTVYQDTMPFVPLNQEYEWYYRNKTNTNSTGVLIDTLVDKRFKIEGHVLRIPSLDESIDTLAFNSRIAGVGNCALDMTKWVTIDMELVPEDLTLVSTYRRGDTIRVPEANEATVQVSPIYTQIDRGYTYEWHLISSTTPVKDSIIYGDAPLMLAFNTNWHNAQLYAKVFTENRCDSAYSDTVRLSMIREFGIVIEESSMMVCGDGEASFVATTIPETRIVRWRWLYSYIPGSWDTITNAVPGVVRESFTTSTLMFNYFYATTRGASYKVVGWDASGQVRESAPLPVVIINSIDAISSTFVRTPTAGGVICVPEGGIEVSYTARPIPAVMSSPYQYRWRVEFADNNLASEYYDADHGYDGDGVFDELPRMYCSNINRYNNARVYCEVRAGQFCPWTQMQYVDTLKLQCLDSLTIGVDSTALCVGAEVRFTLNNEFDAVVTWTASGGTPSNSGLMLDSSSWKTMFLMPGEHSVRLELVTQSSQGCALDTNIKVTVEPGADFEIKIDSVFRTKHYVQVGMDAYLQMVLTDPELKMDSFDFKWTPLDSATGYPVMTPDSQNTRTSIYDVPNMEQRVWAQVIEKARGCMSYDTAILSTYAQLSIDSVFVEDVFVVPGLPPGEDGDPIKDTVIYYPGGEMSLCRSDMLFLTPVVTGGIMPLRFYWEADHEAEAYDMDDMTLLGRIPANREGKDALTTGDQGVIAVRAVDPTLNRLRYTIRVRDNNGEAPYSESIITVVVNVRPLPDVKLTVDPRLIIDGLKASPYIEGWDYVKGEDNPTFYEQQAITYTLKSDASISRYDFYRYVKLEGEKDYRLYDPSSRPNPQRSGSNIYQTSFTKEEGTPVDRADEEWGNKVVGVVKESTYGCQNADTITVLILPIPNVIIPEDDMYPKNRVLLPDLEMEVFDSWGLPIKRFEDENKDGTIKGWDGTYKGRVIHSGTYYFNARVKTYEGSYYYIRGAVTVIRDNQEN
ncbi:MAG: gliding motility-associated C-terminal domain-containing protein [Bacteroidales bacterium]|jgi:plastocyanin|nr:gliding motility-associated C-terminal domain-containing protein [Bacteroidales bacterium]